MIPLSAFLGTNKARSWNRFPVTSKRKITRSSAYVLGVTLILTPLTLTAQMLNPFSVGQSPSSSATARKPIPTLPTLPSTATTEAPASAAQPDAPAPEATTPETRDLPPQFSDYSINLKSDVFGANLFTGAFARQGATQFNPDYSVAVGDKIQARFWGAFEYDASLIVDPKGNIFLPHIGPVQVLGIRNKDLQRVVESAVAKVFRTNVNSYASLAAAQPVRIFVGGFVNRPGLYSGTSMDSLLHYLDQAGGIDPERGSFLNVQVKRDNQIRATVNLYDFLLQGSIPLIQLADGDVIFVTPRQSVVKVSGLAKNARRFEFSSIGRNVGDLIKMAKPDARATHVRVTRNTGAIRNTEYYPLADATHVALRNGDDVEFTADKKPGTITVRVEGEHESAQEYVLPYGARLGELVNQIELSKRSDIDSLQLYRLSVKDRQKQMLETSLKNLEAAVLTARSGTAEESQLRIAEATLILEWVERAKKIEPVGQVIIAKAAGRDELLLENGDILRIAAEDGLVLVSGEVLFPTTVAFDPALNLNDYIHRTGGYTQSADTARVVVAHRDGSFDDVTSGFFGFSSGPAIRAGDEILVLPQVDKKWRQFSKEVAQIIFQLALSARMATRF